MFGPVAWFQASTPWRVKWFTPSSAHMALTSGSSPSSSSQTSSWPGCRIWSAASSVGRTRSSDSAWGTIVVRKATRWPAGSFTGTGSRAVRVARQSVATLMKANQPITPVVTVMTIEATFTSMSSPPCGQCSGSISQTRKPPTKSSAASTSRPLRIGREPSSLRNCTL